METITTGNEEHSTLSPALIIGLRLVWLFLFIVLLAIFIGGIPARFQDLQEVCRAESCVVLALRPEEAQALVAGGFFLAQYAAFHVAIDTLIGSFFALLSILFFWRRFDDPMGILVTFFLMVFGLNFMVEVDGAFVLDKPQLLMVQNTLSALTTIPLILFLFLFPDGRFVPSWTRFFAVLISLIAIIDPLLIAAGSTIPSGQFSFVLVILFLSAVLIGVITQIYRYRTVSNPVERQQTKWVLFGFVALVVPFLGWTLFIELFPLPAGTPRLVFNTLVYGIMAFFLLCFPLSFVIAITRYRLWDIDIIIRRTLIYGLLTGALLLVYFGSVILSQSVVNRITGREEPSQITIILSTLLISALFNPLRRRLQNFIDRQFYRPKYNAAQTLQRFAAKARDEVDMEELSNALLTVVRETVQPEQVTLWLKNTNEKVQA